MNGSAMPLVDTVAGILEALASERPDLLSAYLDMASHSPMRFALQELAGVCGTSLDDFVNVLYRISCDLDRLERRKRWRHPRDVVRHPNVGGLLALCRARQERAGGKGRLKQLAIMEQKLADAYEMEKTRRWVIAFLKQPDP